MNSIRSLCLVGFAAVAACSGQSASGSSGTGTGDGGGGLDGGKSDAGGVSLADGGITATNGNSPSPFDPTQVLVPSCPGSATTGISGKVTDPSGKLALYNVTVFVPNGPVSAFTPGVSCDICGTGTGDRAYSADVTKSDGTFNLTAVPPGNNVPVVIQAGRWRRQFVIPKVTACQTISKQSFAMPKNKSQGEIPQMAIATGSADPFECLFKKMGIDNAEFTAPTGAGRIHYYVSNGQIMTQNDTSAAELWGSAATLKKYDVVLLPCEGHEYKKGSSATQNLIDYANAGGRVFTTHYGYVWIEFAQDPWPSVANWNANSTDQDPQDFDVVTSFPKGAAYADWLMSVGASTTRGVLNVEQSRFNVKSANPAYSTAWLTGSVQSEFETQHITFNTPVQAIGADGGTGAPQCGRVVYSDFHVTSTAVTDSSVPFPDSCSTAPYTAQEKALVFMLFDLATCVQSDSTAPSVPVIQ